MDIQIRMRSLTRRRRCLLLSVATACVLLPWMAAAQALTGALVGTVKDEQGAVLPGALVRVTSPALIGGPTTTTTNEKGQLRFPVLPPGPYLLDIELPGFATYHEEDVRIGAGATLERTAVLKLAGVAESIIVEGSGSRIEARGSGFETRFGPEYLRAIPTRRFSMFDAIRAAPGVSPTSPSSGTVNTVSAFGSGGNENLFLIDGTNFTCPCAGVSRAEPSVDVIQEIQVQSVGVSAEFGNIQGTVFNVRHQTRRRSLSVRRVVLRTDVRPDQPAGPAPGRGSASRQAGTSAPVTVTSRRISAVLSFATGSGSSRDTSTCATTTVSPAPTRRSRGPTNRTRSSRSSRGGSRRACN